MSAPPDEISELHHSMQSSISDVKAWATANMLELSDKTLEQDTIRIASVDSAVK